MNGSPETNPAAAEIVGTDADQVVIRWTSNCRQEAYEAKRNRVWKNRVNFDTYNLVGDFTHKKAGQSREFLPRQAGAVDQISSFIKQAVLESDEWFRIDLEAGVQNPKITAEELSKLLGRQLKNLKFHDVTEDALKLGLLGSLIVAKVFGKRVPKQKFYTERELVDGESRVKLFRNKGEIWQLAIDLVRQEDWFPDPTGSNLYKIQQIEMDLHEVKKLSQGPNAIYDPEIVKYITGGFEDAEQVARKARETQQNQTFQSVRKRVRIWECYGTILDPTTGDVIAENVTWTVCNDRYLIARPKPYPFWHGKMPFVEVPIIRLPKSVWHKAAMDAPTMLNLALNEMFNLQVDKGMMSTWGIRQIRTNWLSDPTKYSNGIPPGATLEANEQCPPGAKVMEPLQTAVETPDSMQTFQQVSSEFQQSAMTNDLRMGVMPSRAVKATEVVEASQTISSMLTGIAHAFEADFMVETLALSWPTCAQHLDDFDTEEVKALLGEKRAAEIAAMDKMEVFAATAQGFKYKAFGISIVLNKMKDFRKYATLLQIIGGSEVLLEEFIKTNDMGKLLTEIMRSLDIRTDRIELSLEQKQANQVASAAGPGQPGATQPGTQPNMQSQQPQAAAMSPANRAGGPQPAEQTGGIPHANFPPSRATPRGGFIPSPTGMGNS